MTEAPDGFSVRDLGRLDYASAYKIQLNEVEAVLAARASGTSIVGRLLLVEHDPVITISRRPGARANLLATPESLQRLGVSVEETDRGGDITYHGPGQLVAYPILDLNVLNLGLHAYMRMLESVVINACAGWGIKGLRDSSATGVWVQRGEQASKIAAMGVRVRKWVSMHGLSLNVAPDMSHFNLIVPCGLAGRSVTSVESERAARGERAPTMSEAKRFITEAVAREIAQAMNQAATARGAVTDIPRQTG